MLWCWLYQWCAIIIALINAFLCFFQFLVNNMVVCGSRFWWFLENENHEDKLQL